jgi:hypothetical protein
VKVTALSTVSVPAPGCFDDLILHVLHHVAVVAGATGKNVYSSIADERIAQTVARGIDGPVAAELDVFYVVGQRKADMADDAIESGIGIFDDGVAGILDDVEVIPCAAGERVDHAVPDERIVQRVSGRIDRRAAQELDALDVRRQDVADEAQCPVATTVQRFDDGVRGVVDDVVVVTEATRQGVNANAPIEDVAGSVADDDVVSGIAGTVDRGASEELEYLDIVAKRVCDAAQNAICPCILRFDNDVT